MSLLKAPGGGLATYWFVYIFPIGDKDPQWYPSVGDGL